MAKVRDRIQNGILGDINPRPSGPAPERRPDERIVGNEPASQLMGRTYRQGFELPQIA